jgi:hypothetical protein
MTGLARWRCPAYPIAPFLVEALRAGTNQTGPKVGESSDFLLWLHHFRRLATQYDVENLFGMVRLGCMQILFRYL